LSGSNARTGNRQHLKPQSPRNCGLFVFVSVPFLQRLAMGSTIFSMEFLMVLSGFEFSFEKVPWDKFRLIYGFL